MASRFKLVGFAVAAFGTDATVNPRPGARRSRDRCNRLRPRARRATGRHAAPARAPACSPPDPAHRIDLPELRGPEAPGLGGAGPLQRHPRRQRPSVASAPPTRRRRSKDRGQQAMGADGALGLVLELHLPVPVLRAATPPNKKPRRRPWTAPQHLFVEVAPFRATPPCPARGSATVTPAGVSTV